MKNVIILTGMISTGKTTLLNELANEGYKTLSEGYATTDKPLFDNRLILSQWKWIGEWFEKIMLFFNQNKEQSYVFVDNSPLFSAIKTPYCFPLLESVQASMKELQDMSFHFIHIELYCDRKILQKRIQNRLKAEPFRLQYNENNEAFLDTLYSQFQQYTQLWDYHLNSANKTPQELKTELLNLLSATIDFPK